MISDSGDETNQVADKPVGVVLSAAVGLGVIAYGTFGVLSARPRDLAGPRND